MPIAVTDARAQPTRTSDMNLRFALLSCLIVAGCATTPAPPHPSPTLAGDPAHPAAAVGWVRTELYFGIGGADDAASGMSEADWRAFLDREVTPRFPDGLSVYDIYGQWRSKGKLKPERQRSKVIMLLYQDTPEHRDDIDAIRAAWKHVTGDQSVLRVTQPADVSF